MKIRPFFRKQASSFLKSGLLFGCILSLGHMASAATLLEYWDFNNVPSTFSTPTLGSFATTTGVASPAVNNGEIYSTTNKTISSNAGSFTGGPVFSNGLINMSNVKGTANSGNTGTLSWGAFSDSGSVASGDPTTKQGSLAFFSPSRNLTDNPNLIFTLSSTGYSGLTLNFDSRRPGNGTNPLVTWSYSLDGGASFTTFTAPALAGTAGVFAAYSLTLPTAVDNLSSFQLKAAYDFTPNGTGTSYAIDNLQLVGAVAVPEPGTVALLATGGAILAFLRRRGSREKI